MELIEYNRRRVKYRETRMNNIKSLKTKGYRETIQTAGSEGRTSRNEPTP
jgi:hypothetical protein